MFVSHLGFFFFLKKKIGTRLATGRGSVMQTVYARLSLLRRGKTPLRADLRVKWFMLRERGFQTPARLALPVLPTLPAALRSPTAAGGAPQPESALRSPHRLSSASRRCPPAALRGRSPLRWHPPAPPRSAPPGAKPARPPPPFPAPAPSAAPPKPRRAARRARTPSLSGARGAGLGEQRSCPPTHIHAYLHT